VSAATCIQLAPNPLYVAVVLVTAWVVVEVHRSDHSMGSAFPLLVAAGVLMGVVKVVLTAATVHGTGHVLFTTPEATLPRALGGFTVGGSVEAGVITRAAVEAFAIVGVMAVFGAFNAVVSHDDLVRSLPRTFHEAGVVLTVGLTFVPATITSIRAIQESDRSRTGGAVVRRGRLVRLVVPLLESGMERAVSLSESMEARGFARHVPTRLERAAGVGLLVGLLSFAAALVALVGGSRAGALVALSIGALALVGSVGLGSAGSSRTRHRPRHLEPRDVWLIASSGLALAGVAALSISGTASLRWFGDPLGWPPFQVATVVSLLLLGVPALVPRDAAPVPISRGELR
jgi:energy-coupling factor transport system permease protein